ncbi:Putative amidohydrolase [Mycobacteroides abscessus subsp. massiliense]|nr:Putative amidohydrolase [Mycobacteroides abscessus subsp. massiliense]
MQRLQTIVSRELSPFEPAVVTVGYLHAGAKDNIIPDDAELGINVRTFNEEVRRKTLASITRRCRRLPRCSVSISVPRG